MCKTKAILILLFFGFFAVTLQAQNGYTYGTVVGGEVETKNVTSFLQDNEEGYRIILVNSTRSRGSQGMQGGGNQSSGGVQLLDVPTDTDYLELLLEYANLNPRYIRKNKIKILRIDDPGDPPFLSKDIERYWTSYNFKKEYKKGGPFSTVQPGDIIFIQGKGLINRPFFDPLNDIRFLLSIPSIALSVVTVYNAFN